MDRIITVFFYGEWSTIEKWNGEQLHLTAEEGEVVIELIRQLAPGVQILRGWGFPAAVKRRVAALKQADIDSTDTSSAVAS